MKSAFGRLLPRKFVKHYVTPLRMGGTQVPYDAKRFFESWHRAAGDMSDAETISASSSSLATRYHYNAVESSIIECFAERTLARPLRVLDVGSGAGHWIDFYRDVFGAEEVVGLEISEPAVEALRRKYAGSDGIRIDAGDVSSADLSVSQRFTIVNAIGVMFHIVEDDAWARALRNLAAHTAPGGAIVVGGQFGLVTRNVQFHRTDEFSSWDEFRRAEAAPTLVNKRIRSLRRWKQAAEAAKLRVERVQRTRSDRAIQTPENNVLILVPA